MFKNLQFMSFLWLKLSMSGDSYLFQEGSYHFQEGFYLFQEGSYLFQEGSLPILGGFFTSLKNTLNNFESLTHEAKNRKILATRTVLWNFWKISL